jgi:hypothetical protein
MLLRHGGLLNVTRNQAVAKDRPHREATIMDAKMARIKIKARDNHRANHKASVKVKDSRAGMVALKTQVVKALAEVVKDDRMALTLREEAVAKLRRLHNLRIKSWMACWGGQTGCFCIVHIFTFLSHFLRRVFIDIRAWWLSIQNLPLIWQVSHRKLRTLLSDDFSALA